LNGSDRKFVKIGISDILGVRQSKSRAFKHNQRIVRKIDRLVQQVVKGESVELPFEAGLLLSAEAVRAEMDHRWNEASKAI
jgi:hypothetical protein